MKLIHIRGKERKLGKERGGGGKEIKNKNKYAFRGGGRGGGMGGGCYVKIKNFNSIKFKNFVRHFIQGL